MQGLGKRDPALVEEFLGKVEDRVGAGALVRGVGEKRFSLGYAPGRAVLVVHDVFALFEHDRPVWLAFAPVELLSRGHAGVAQQAGEVPEASGRDFYEQRQADIVLGHLYIRSVGPTNLYTRELATADAAIAQAETFQRASAGQADVICVCYVMVDQHGQALIIHGAVDLDHRATDAHRHGGVNRDEIWHLRLLASLNFKVVGVGGPHEREPRRDGLKFERGATETEQMRIAIARGGRPARGPARSRVGRRFNGFAVATVLRREVPNIRAAAQPAAREPEQWFGGKRGHGRYGATVTGRTSACGGIIGGTEDLAGQRFVDVVLIDAEASVRLTQMNPDQWLVSLAPRSSAVRCCRG